MILHDLPVVAQFKSLIDQSCIDNLLSLNRYIPSLAYNHQTNTSSILSNRSSFSLMDTNDEYIAIRKLMLSRIYETLNLLHPLENCETIQLTRYQIGQLYDPHYDHFNVPKYESLVSNDRIATALLYLNDDFVGGETIFTKLNIRITPKQGDILYFEYPSKLAMKMEHGSSPILKGEKKIISLWIRQKALKNNLSSKL
jgi:prolyl 4-hydroxylase